MRILFQYKTIAVVMLILKTSLVSGQIDTAINLMLNEEIVKTYNKRNISNELIDSCNSVWKIKESIWFHRWKNPIPLGPDMDRSKNVSICYRTKNYVVVYYLNYFGRALAPRLLLLDKDLHYIGTWRLYSGARNKKQLIALLRNKQYEIDK